MVLIAKSQTEHTLLLNDVEDISILGLDHGNVLLFSAISSNRSRSGNMPRTVIGGMQLSDGEQIIYHRHPTSVRITHASINAARSLCCFVTREETYDVYVVEIGSPGSGRLFSLKFSRSSPIRAYLAPHDIILLLYRDAVTVFRMPNRNNGVNEAVSMDRDAQLNDCVYFQWDTLQQRLHVIKKRPPMSTKTPSANEDEAYLYTTYTVNARGQFDCIMKVDFDLRVPASSLSHGNFEILSSDTSLYLCWQLTMDEETEKVEYAIVSLGHGRTLYISKRLDKGNREIFQSRKVHFGLLDGDYVFADLRGEFTHLLNFNVQLNFVNHLFLPNDPDSLPYHSKYTSQRGLIMKTSTLLYEKKNLATYTITINTENLIQSISSATIQPIISFALIASKDSTIIRQILEKILFEMYDDLNTKNYLMEILTASIFNQIVKRQHNNKYALVFPATTISNRNTNVTDIIVRPVPHHRTYQPERCGSTNLDETFYDKLKVSFYHTRKYRRKLSYYHPMMPNPDESDSFDDPGGDASPTRRVDRLSSSPSLDRPRSSRFFSFGSKRERAPPIPEPVANDNLRPFATEPKNEWIFQNVSNELKELHSEWEPERIKKLAYEYVQITQSQCDELIASFRRLAGFDQAQGSIDDMDRKPASEKYKTLLVVMEKLYLAVVELGFSPTDNLQKALLEVSFCVMPFDQFVAAIDQNILTLTQEFVQQFINDEEDPKSYAIAEQMILMLRDNDSNLQSDLFELVGNNHAKRMSAQLLVARRFSTDRRYRLSARNDIGNASDEIQVDEILNGNHNPTGMGAHSRLVEQAAVTFYRDCLQRKVLDKDELRTVKAGLLTLASSAP